MKVFKLPVLVTLALVGATCLAVAQVPTFRSRIDIVNFAVTVTDKKGEFITDLDESDFEVYEDGKKQTLKYFSGSRDAQSAAGPLHLGVLFDISGSMEEDIATSRTAAIKFLKAIDNAEDMTLVDFDTEVRLARYGQSEFPRLVERIRTRRVEGNTALYDAVGVYLHGANEIDGRKILVLYTDGGDNVSRTSLADLETLLKSSDVTVYAIGFLEHQGSSAVQELRMRLNRITEVTGGQVYYPVATKELDKIYDRIRQEIKAQYSLGYVSTNTAQDGSWRKVEIRILRNGGKNIRIRTRKGYYALYKKPE